MASALEAAWAKYQRACKDLKALDADTKRFLDRKPYGVAVKFESETGWHIAYVRLVEEPPPALSVHVGSLAYQCYSALNHVVWQLAVSEIGQERAEAIRKHIDFPTAKCPLDFKSLLVAQNVSEAARAVLDELQPYDGRHNLRTVHHLFLIKELADADKHRVLAPSYGLGYFADILSGAAFEWDPVASGPTFERDLPPRVPPWSVPIDMLENGTALARIRFETGNEHANVRVNGQPTTEIVFNSDNWGVTRSRLGDLIATTDHCLSRLATLFPDEPWPPKNS